MQAAIQWQNKSKQQFKGQFDLNEHTKQSHKIVQMKNHLTPTTPMYV